jgi:hypothetical protein
MATRESKLVSFPQRTPEAQPTNLIDAGNSLLTILKSAQRTLADYVHPEGITKDQALKDLLSLLDGSSAQKARDVWSASVAEAWKPRK